jgi:hypothetical protein
MRASGATLCFVSPHEGLMFHQDNRRWFNCITRVNIPIVQFGSQSFHARANIQLHPASTSTYGSLIMIAPCGVVSAGDMAVKIDRSCGNFSTFPIA